MGEKGKLFLVSTPIGNLKDITLRALEVLGSIDWIACEDTRETRKLLAHYKIRARLVSFHDHSSERKGDELVGRMLKGETVALVTDSGTPLVSDPGYPLVRAAVREGIPVEVIPGPTAFVAGLIASGIPCESFAFEGYLPQKEGRSRKSLEGLRDETRTLVFYESPHRLIRTLGLMIEILGDRHACVAREITKKFEEYLRGNLTEIRDQILARQKIGEVVLIVEGKKTEKGSEKIES